MSIDSCTNCGRMIDTDYDDQAYIASIDGLDYDVPFALCDHEECFCFTNQSTLIEYVKEQSMKLFGKVYKQDLEKLKCLKHLSQ